MNYINTVETPVKEGVCHLVYGHNAPNKVDEMHERGFHLIRATGVESKILLFFERDTPQSLTREYSCYFNYATVAPGKVEEMYQRGFHLSYSTSAADKVLLLFAHEISRDDAQDS